MENPRSDRSNADVPEAPVEPDVARPSGGVSRKISAAWGMGHLSGAVGLSVIGHQMLYFLTNYVGMSPVVAGSILAVAKITDVLSDIVVGFLSDGINTRWGRRRPWILGGAIVVALMVMIIFNMNNVPQGLTALVCTIALFTFYTAYTCIQVPLVAMSAELSTGYKGSGKLWSWGMLFHVLGANVIGTSGTAAILLLYGGGMIAYNAMGYTVAGIVLASAIVFFIGTRDAPRPMATRMKKKPPIREWIGSLLRNGSLVAYTAQEVIGSLALSMMSVSMTYYLFDILKLGQQGMVVFGVAGLPMAMVALFGAVKLQKWVPKHVIAAGGIIGSGSVILTLRTFDAGTGLLVFGSLVFCWGLFSMSSRHMTNALIPDLIHADALQTGLRREGAIAAMTGAIQKTTPALVTMVFSFALAASGYVPGARGGPQPQSAVDMIYMFNCVIPGILMMVSAAVLLLFYKLDEKRLHEIEAEAAARGVLV